MSSQRTVLTGRDRGTSGSVEEASVDLHLEWGPLQASLEVQTSPALSGPSQKRRACLWVSRQPPASCCIDHWNATEGCNNCFSDWRSTRYECCDLAGSALWDSACKGRSAAVDSRPALGGQRHLMVFGLWYSNSSPPRLLLEVSINGSARAEPSPRPSSATWRKPTRPMDRH
jgi:hypothetical protein